jgi:hypothetical protein
VFQMDHTKVDRDVAIIIHVCCKGLLPMFHLCFLDTYCKCVYLNITYVSYIRLFSSVFRCVFFQVFQKHIKCFVCLQTYDATIVFGCFRNRSGVTSLMIAFCCIVSMCPLGAGRTSVRRHGPIPLLSLGRHEPHVECEGI